MKTLTIGELKNAIKDIPDDREVWIAYDFDARQVTYVTLDRDGDITFGHSLWSVKDPRDGWHKVLWEDGVGLP